MSEIEKWYHNYQHQHKKKRIDWESGIFQHLPFEEFIVDLLRYEPRNPYGQRGLGELIEQIMLEYRCSYGVAYYKLMGWLKQNSDKYERVWVGHNRRLVIRQREENNK